MKPTTKRVLLHLFFNCIFATFVILGVILFYKNILLTSLVVGGVSLIGLLKWKSKSTTIIFFAGGIFGACAEMLSIAFGVWHYSHYNFVNIPFWLFIVWADASAFLYQSGKEIKRWVRER